MLRMHQTSLCSVPVNSQQGKDIAGGSKSLQGWLLASWASSRQAFQLPSLAAFPFCFNLFLINLFN